MPDARRTRGRPLVAGLGLVLGVSGLSGLALVAGAGSAEAASTPDYEMPFPCGDVWNGSSRYNHSPSALSIDWNRDRDLGAMVIASAPGRVTSVTDLGNRSYGRYVVVDHGNGRSTLYAHLSAFWSVPGQAVDQGTPLGLVGSSGGSTGPHLHFEERTNGKDHRAWFHRIAFRMGTSKASVNCGDAPVVGDWDGNGTSNIGIQHRSTTPSFVGRRPGQARLRTTFGWRTDQALSGDWDGNGTDELGVRRPGLRAFVLRDRSGGTRQITLGSISDTGLAGDWNGDGRTDVGVWHPRSRVFALRSADGSVRRVTYGAQGDRAVVGDWDGDKRADVGVFRPSTGTFWLRTVSGGKARSQAVRWGSSSSLPVTGDWNGDGVGDVGVWEPSTATYSLLTTPTKASPSVRSTKRWGYRRG